MDRYSYNDQLQTQRLITRFLTLEDISAWTTFFDDEEALQYLPDLGLKTSKDRAEHWINKQLDRYKNNRFGLQALVDKKTNEFVGQSGLLLQEVDGEELVEVGYHIFKKHWGKGYAPEAAKLFMNYAFEHHISEAIVSIIDIRNTNSQRVAQKNLLDPIKQTKWSGLDVFIFERKKSLTKLTSRA